MWADARAYGLAVIGVALLQLGTAGYAQNASFPVRPVRVIVPGSAGTGMEYMGRSLAQVLTEAYKQKVIIDNRAGSLIGTGIVAGAAKRGCRSSV